MARGNLKSVLLSNRVTTGREQWLDWHAHFAETRVRRLQQVGPVSSSSAEERAKQCVICRCQLCYRKADICFPLRS